MQCCVAGIRVGVAIRISPGPDEPGLVKARGGLDEVGVVGGGPCVTLPPSITSRRSPTPSTRYSNTNSPPPSTEGGRVSREEAARCPVCVALFLMYEDTDLEV